MEAAAPLPAGPSSYVAVALCSFPAGPEAATVLHPGEQLRVLSEDGEWWEVASLVTGKQCLVPSSHVAKVRHRWLYEGVSREKAEELLLLPGNRSGSFLIRESQSRQGCYSLSVRRSNRAAWDSVKHYRVQRLGNGWVYIAPRLTFPRLQDLVDYYSEIGDGLCCLLTEPCCTQGAARAPAQSLPPPRAVQKSALNWQEINSSVLFAEDPALEEEESPVSQGLREAISSYLFLTEELPPESGAGHKGTQRTST